MFTPFVHVHVYIADDFSSQCSGFGRKEVVEYLLQYGADVHAKDDGGFLFSSPINIVIHIISPHFLSKRTACSKEYKNLFFVQNFKETQTSVMISR